MQLTLINARLGSFLLATLFCAAVVSAQQSVPQTPPGRGKIDLDVVVVDTKSGSPATDLQQQDFTVLDNKVPKTITSFGAVTSRQAPIDVVLVIDAVNTDFVHVASERIGIDKFLRADNGLLTYPIALMAFTDKGIQVVQNFSSDGDALSASLDRDDIGLRSIGRSARNVGEAERLQLSIQALRQLVSSEAARPGRKVILWVSPGWPLLSGRNTDLDSKQQRQVFADVVRFSTQFLQGHITLYSINPLGSSEPLINDSYYNIFLKGISKPSEVLLGDLGLQVLATQSGGLALNFANDIGSLVQQCVTDTAPYYEISFDSSPARQPDEYHHLEIKLAKRGLTARTHQSYYAQPTSPD